MPSPTHTRQTDVDPTAHRKDDASDISAPSPSRASPTQTGAAATGQAIPGLNSEYSTAAYWDKRFESEQDYEWLQSYADIRDWLGSHISRSERILIIGCGNSGLPLAMASDGYTKVTSTDISPNVIRSMQERHAKLRLQQAHAQQAVQVADVEWEVADMLDLRYADGSFDVVLDKATLDCLFADCVSPWDLPEATHTRVHTALSELHRVLTPTGVLLQISFAQPHFRRPFLLAHEFAWGLQHTLVSVDGGLHYTFYCMRKGARTAQDQPVQLLTYDPDKHATRLGNMHENVDREDFLSFINV